MSAIVGVGLVGLCAWAYERTQRVRAQDLAVELWTELDDLHAATDALGTRHNANSFDAFTDAAARVAGAHGARRRFVRHPVTGTTE